MYWFHFLLAVVLGLGGSAAYAACSAPEGTAGQVVFSETAKAMQYCNGTNWINTGAVIANAPNTGCSNPTGRRGSVIFNASQGVVQFCNGSNWVDTACARDRKKNGSGCTGGGRAGTMRYVGGSVNELQFCDSTDWVAMGWPCGPEQALNVANVFSTDLYTGNGGTQTIINGIDLAGSGGLVWIKARTQTFDHVLNDTQRGLGGLSKGLELYANKTDAEVDIGSASSPSLLSFILNGFTLGGGSRVNLTGSNFAAWTFRRAPKFFDVVTWTGDGTNNRAISHSLGVEPGMVIVKATGMSSDWAVYHHSVGTSSYLRLNTTAAASAISVFPTTPTASQFYVNNYGITNQAGENYVAYVFAHDPSPEGVIQCGGYSGTPGFGKSVLLGWQPQFIFIKNSSGSGPWNIYDKKRGILAGSGDYVLQANTSNVEFISSGSDDSIRLETTGFTLITSGQNTNAAGTYIYCAIRAEGS